MHFLFFPQEAIVNLSGYKSDLFNINVGVHNLLAGRTALMSIVPTSDKDDCNSVTQERGSTGQKCVSNTPLDHEEIIRKQGTETNDHQSFFEDRYDHLKNEVVRLYVLWDNILQR